MGIDSRLARQAVLLEGSTIGCGTANTWRRTPKCTEQLYWPPFCTAPRHGLRTDIIFDVYLRGSIRAVFVHSLASTGVISLQMLKAGVPSIEALLLKTQQRWAGHVHRMEDHRLPNIVLYGELISGSRNRGAPKKRHNDSLKTSLKACHINPRVSSCRRLCRLALHSSWGSLMLWGKTDIRIRWLET